MEIFAGFQVFSLYCSSFEISALNRRRSKEGLPRRFCHCTSCLMLRIQETDSRYGGTVPRLRCHALHSESSFRRRNGTARYYHSVGIASRFKVYIEKHVDSTLACISSESVQLSGPTANRRFEMRSVETSILLFIEISSRISVPRHGQSPSIYVRRISNHSQTCYYSTIYWHLRHTQRPFRSWS